MATQPSKQFETFANPRPERDYEINMECPEFTCVCPRTGQPDFATIRIHYVPDQLCVELKSLKLYLWSYRDEGTFHEAVINKILDDLVQACQPRKNDRGRRFQYSRRHSYDGHGELRAILSFLRLEGSVHPSARKIARRVHVHNLCKSCCSACGSAASRNEGHR